MLVFFYLLYLFFSYLCVRKGFSLKWKTQLISLTLEVSVPFNSGEMKQEEGGVGGGMLFGAHVIAVWLQLFVKEQATALPSDQMLSHKHIRKLIADLLKITTAGCTWPFESEQGHQHWHKMGFIYRAALKSSRDRMRWLMPDLFKHFDAFVAGLLTCTWLLHT